MPARMVSRVSNVVEIHVHRHAAEARNFSLVPDGRSIRGAFVDFDRTIVRKQHTVLNVRAGGVGPGVALDPGSRRGHPTAAVAARQRLVGRQSVVVIIRVHEPAKLQLPVVAQARDLLAFGLGVAKRRQKQRGQNRDDSDNDEQFDEREPTAGRLRAPESTMKSQTRGERGRRFVTARSRDAENGFCCAACLHVITDMW